MAVGLKIIKGDIVFNKSGSLDFIPPGEKCARDFGKLLQAESEHDGNRKSFYRYNPDYGTEVDNKLLYFGLSRATIKDVLITKLNEGITKYLRTQESRLNLNIEEIITGVSIDASYDEESPNILNVKIMYRNVKGDSIELGEYQQEIG